MIYLFFGSKSCSFPTLAFHLPHPGIYDLHRAIYAAFCLLGPTNGYVPGSNPPANLYGIQWQMQWQILVLIPMKHHKTLGRRETLTIPVRVVLRLILGLHNFFGH